MDTTGAGRARVVIRPVDVIFPKPLKLSGRQAFPDRDGCCQSWSWPVGLGLAWQAGCLKDKRNHINYAMPLPVPEPGSHHLGSALAQASVPSARGEPDGSFLCEHRG